MAHMKVSTLAAEVNLTLVAMIKQHVLGDGGNALTGLTRINSLGGRRCNEI
jgi:hypothetical protein